MVSKSYVLLSFPVLNEWMKFLNDWVMSGVNYRWSWIIHIGNCERKVKTILKSKESKLNKKQQNTEIKVLEWAARPLKRLSCLPQLNFQNKINKYTQSFKSRVNEWKKKLKLIDLKMKQIHIDPFLSFKKNVLQKL